MRTTKTRFFVVLSIFFTTAVLAYVGNGCSRSESGSLVSSSNSTTTTDPGGSTTPSGIPIIPGALTVSVLSKTQIIDQLSACSGLAVPSDATLAMFDLKKGALSTTGSVDTVTGPMMMGVISIAGEICNDLINQEISLGARLFTGFGLAGNVLPNSSQISDSISKISISCWQRNESSTERQIITDMITSSIGAGEAMAARKAALMICTSMLSSQDSIKH